MTAAVVTGWSAVSAAGIGVPALVGRMAVAAAGSGAAGAELGRSWDGDPLPQPRGHALPGFSVREQLGRKGTSSYDRGTALAVVACRDALAEAGIEVDDATRARIGVVLGTTVGSFKSTSDFSRETLVQPRPYLVNPVLFPNTVMNCAAGQVAIRLGLQGVNATVAGSQQAFLASLRYATMAIGRGYADVMLTGAVEEFSPHRAWAAELAGSNRNVPVGEAAAVMVLARMEIPVWAGRHRDAEILSVATGYGLGGDAAALTGCVAVALRRAGVQASDVTTLVTGEDSEEDRRETGPAAAALGHEPQRLLVKRSLGECDAASGALALAVLLALHRDGKRDGELSLLTSAGTDGAVSAAIVRGWGRDGAYRE